jgi:hypothetical protein
MFGLEESMCCCINGRTSRRDKSSTSFTILSKSSKSFSSSKRVSIRRSRSGRNQGPKRSIATILPGEEAFNQQLGKGGTGFWVWV